jgi:hypothetical protein
MADIAVDKVGGVITRACPSPTLRSGLTSSVRGKMSALRIAAGQLLDRFEPERPTFESKAIKIV